MTQTKASVRIIAVAIAMLNAPFPLASAREVAAQGPQQLTPEQRAAQQAIQAERREEAVADRQRMMDLLGIPAPAVFPPAADDPTRPQHLTQREGASVNNWYDGAGNTHVRSSWNVWSNYDESKAGGYTLPDPLVTKGGQRVTSAEMWWNQRRPEILEDFRREIYGRVPENAPTVSFAVVETDATTFAGRAVVKRVLGTIDNSAYPAATPQVELTIYMPPNLSAPVPVIVRIGGGGFGGGNAAPQLSTVAEQVLALGWAYATFNPGALQADNGAGLDEGIIGLVNRGQPRQPEQWGSLTAWSWGLSRVLDYFETDPQIDVRRSAVQGHSRYGKTALLTGALDPRWGMVFSSCSGAMGASLEMRHWGETVDNVAGAGEYHWMAGNFLKYGGNWQKMPVDAHSLIALVAPRPIFITGGTADQWSDPHGEFLAAAGADPVYRLLGAGGLGQTTMPEPDISLVSGALAFRNHEGGHTDAPDWPVFLEFAQRHFAFLGASANAPPPSGAQEIPAGFRDEFLRQFDASMSKFEALAGAMPAAAYSWSPGEGVMPVAEVYAHVARYNYLYPSQGLGADVPAGIDLATMESITLKPDIVSLLALSGEHVRTLVRQGTDADWSATTRLYGRDVQRWTVLLQLLAHMNEHLGQSIAYARMNDVVPPWSR